MHPLKLLTHLLLIAASCSLYMGCYSEVTVKPGNREEYQREEITIISPGGLLYELEAPWEMDSQGNITGRGTSGREIRTYSRIDRTREPFVGTIPADSIATIEMYDGTKTFLAVAAVVGATVIVAGSIYVGSGSPFKHK